MQPHCECLVSDITRTNTQEPCAGSWHYCEYLDRWTYYRTQQEIDSVYNKYFCDIQHIEDYWLQKRTGKRLIDVSFFASIQRLVVTKLCGMVFVAHKLDDQGA